MLDAGEQVAEKKMEQLQQTYTNLLSKVKKKKLLKKTNFIEVMESVDDIEKKLRKADHRSPYNAFLLFSLARCQQLLRNSTLEASAFYESGSYTFLSSPCWIGRLFILGSWTRVSWTGPLPFWRILHRGLQLLLHCDQGMLHFITNELLVDLPKSKKIKNCIHSSPWDGNFFEG